MPVIVIVTVEEFDAAGHGSLVTDVTLPAPSWAYDVMSTGLAEAIDGKIPTRPRPIVRTASKLVVRLFILLKALSCGVWLART
jgi:hypothetical protein